MAERDQAAKIHVVGPIVWHLPGSRHVKIDGIVLAAFDAPALSDAVARSCGELTNFWKAKNLRAYIDDLIRLRAELQSDFAGPVKLVLKMKRFNPDYDQDYAKYVTTRFAEQHLELAPVNENIFDLIASSDITIVFPYSTSAYVAASAKVPAVYHDPTGTLLPTHESADGLWFSSGYDELLGKCRTILAARLDKALQYAG
jgi:polysaccharide biosynthesis PFTS motif protein